MNKEKRMDWCLDRVLSVMIWTDECSVQLESHRKITYHKHGEPSKMMSRPKHPPNSIIYMSWDICQGCNSSSRFYRYPDRCRIYWYFGCSVATIDQRALPFSPSFPTGVDGSIATSKKMTLTVGKRQPPALN